MRDRLRSWFTPTSQDADVAQRQFILNVVLLGLAGPSFIIGVIMLILWILGLSPAAGAISLLGVQAFYLLSWWLGRRGRVILAAYIPVTAVFLVMAASLFQVGVGHVSTVGMAMVITTAGLLIGPRAALIFVILSIGAYGWAGVAQTAGMIPEALLPEASVAADAVGLGLGLSVLVILNWLSKREMGKALRLEREISEQLQIQSQELERQVTDRTKGLERRAIQLQTTAEIAKLATELTDPEFLLSQSIELIRERFGLYHASIFLMDETGTWAELAASTGEAGQTMLARRHRLAEGSASIIGWVTANRLPRVALDVEQDPFHLENPLLPETRSEMAVPLVVSQRLLGALDVQSTELNAFVEADVRTLEAIAGELAISIDSARIQSEMRDQLDRIESAYQVQARGAWSRILRSGVPSVIHLGQDGEVSYPDEVEFFSVEEAILQEGTVVTAEGREVAVPLMVRGELIAVIASRKPPGVEQWNEEEIALIEAVAGQAALALENARQRAEEQRRVVELEVINRVSQAVSQMVPLDTLYRVVHRQVNQVLSDVDLSIVIYDPENEQIEIPYFTEGETPSPQGPIPLGQDMISVVIRSRQPLLLDADLEDRGGLSGFEGLDQSAKSWLGVPMLLGDALIGVIIVQDQVQEQRFTDDDAALLTTLASQIAAGIQNAKLLDQVQKAARRERLIHEITSKVRRSPDMKTILETTTREIGRALNAVRATVTLGEVDSEEALEETSVSAPEEGNPGSGVQQGEQSS